MDTDRDPYRCECGAELDHPEAACLACDFDPNPAPQDDRALDAWETLIERQAAGSLA